MAFDFKKEYKEFYMPKKKPEIVTVPKMNYIAVNGKNILKGMRYECKNGQKNIITTNGELS